MKRLFALLIASLIPALSVFCATSVSAVEEGRRFSDEQSRSVTEIVLENGRKTGVKWTEIKLDGNTYGKDRAVNIAEFDLSNPKLSFEVINSGKYIVSSAKLDKAASAYNAEHKGQTVLAAINGDLWMTAVHSSSEVTTKTLKATRGILMIDGEIWATQQITAENYGATNAERGTESPPKAAFGVTDSNQPLVGMPEISVSMSVGGKNIKADGLNRLPALESLIVYNHRVNSANYVLNDAYEIELEAVGSVAFTLDGKVRAKVKAIYPTGSETRPAINENSIILTARGAAISRLSGIKIGDEISFEASLDDLLGRTELWQNVVDAIGGHMLTISDGKPYSTNSSKTAYPTSLIGYKDDGTVAFISVTSALDNSRAALKQNQAYRFCSEYGYNSVFYLDGGGSTTFVTLEDGSYKVRNKCSDGAPRAVINGVAVVWNTTPVCDKQGDLGYIRRDVRYSDISPTYVDGALLAELVVSPNSLSAGYDAQRKAMRLKAIGADPYITANYSMLGTVMAEEYPYMVFKVKSDAQSASTFALYYSTGDDYGASEERSVRFTVNPGMGKWQYIVVDMSGKAFFDGRINSLRLDPFDSGVPSGERSVYIGAIVLCKNADEASRVKEGWTPEGAITDFLAYRESLSQNEPMIKDEAEGSTSTTTAASTPANNNMTSEQPKGAGGCSSELASALLPAATVAVISVSLKRKKQDKE